MKVIKNKNYKTKALDKVNYSPQEIMNFKQAYDQAFIRATFNHVKKSYHPVPSYQSSRPYRPELLFPETLKRLRDGK